MAENTQQATLVSGMFDGVQTAEPRSTGDIREILGGETFTPDTRQSNIGTLFTCHRMFLLKERAGLRPWGYRSAPSIGTLSHIHLNALYMGASVEQADGAVDTAVSVETGKLVAWTETHSNVEAADQMFKQMEKDAGLAKIMSQVHWGTYPLDRDRFKPVLVEKDLFIRIPEIPRSVGGRPDILLYGYDPSWDREGYVLLDHKFTSDPAAWGLTAGFSTQARIYRLLVTAHYTDAPVLGMVFNCIQKPSCTWKSSQTYDDYLSECRDWYAARDDTVGTGKIFQRGPRKGLPEPRWEWSDNKDRFVAEPPMRSYSIPFTEPLLPTDLRKMIAATARAGGCQPTLGNFAPTGEAADRCHRRYGKPCPYLPLCSVDPLNWPAIVERQYTRETPEVEVAETT